MESPDEFLVVDSGIETPSAKAVSELRYTIDLFHSSIDAINQSTILLKDQLQNSLVASLQRLSPDDTISTEEILKSFNRSVTSKDDVRREYVKRLCTRLVTIEAEKQALQTECAQLKAGTWLANESEEIKSLDQMVTDILRSVRRLEKEVGITCRPSAAPPEQTESTLSLITFRLADIQDRLSQLHISGKLENPKPNDNNEKNYAKPSVKETESSSDDNHRRFQRKVEQMLGLAAKSVAFNENLAGNVDSKLLDSDSKDEFKPANLFYSNDQPLMNTNLLWSPSSNPQLYHPGAYQQFQNYGPRSGRPMLYRGPFFNEPRHSTGYCMYGGNMNYQAPWRGYHRPPNWTYNKRSKSRPSTPKSTSNSSKESGVASK